MGASISKEKIESMSTKKLLSLKASTVRDLKPEVRDLYDQRMYMSGVSVQQMRGFSEEEVKNFSTLGRKYLKSEVQAVFEKRVLNIKHQ